MDQLKTKRQNRATTSGVTDGRKDITVNDNVTAYGGADDLTTSDEDMRTRQMMTNPIEDDSTLPGETPILTQKAPFYLGTLNVRTLAKPGKLELIVKELERYRWDVIGLSETHLPGSGEQRCGDIILSYSGRPDGKHRQGVGFLLTRKAKRALIATKLVSERLMMIRLRAKAQNITVIQVYAPDSYRPDEEVDTFY